MDYLEYKDFLAHARGSFGASIKKRLAGAKKAGSQMLSNATGGGSGGGSVGGKSGRKWKKHKYIAIINGRYIYPAKRALKQTFTKEGRRAKLVQLSRNAGRAQSRLALATPRLKEASRRTTDLGVSMQKVIKDLGAKSVGGDDRVLEVTPEIKRTRRYGDAETKYQTALKKERKLSNEVAEARDRFNYTKSLIDKHKQTDKKIADAKQAVRRAKNKAVVTKRRTAKAIKENLTEKGREEKAIRLSRDAGRIQNRYVSEKAEANLNKEMADFMREAKKKNPNSDYNYDSSINAYETARKQANDRANKAAFESAYARKKAEDAKKKLKKKR